MYTFIYVQVYIYMFVYMCVCLEYIMARNIRNISWQHIHATHCNTLLTYHGNTYMRQNLFKTSPPNHTGSWKSPSNTYMRHAASHDSVTFTNLFVWLGGLVFNRFCLMYVLPWQVRTTRSMSILSFSSTYRVMHVCTHLFVVDTYVFSNVSFALWYPMCLAPYMISYVFQYTLHTSSWLTHMCPLMCHSLYDILCVSHPIWYHMCFSTPYTPLRGWHICVL